MAVPEFTTEELEQEEWKPVPGYERYTISNLGRLKGTRRSRKTLNHIFSPPIDQGYYRTQLYKDGRTKHFCIHRLVAMAFLGEPPEGHTEINHKDGQKLNNRLGNIEYCTREHNATHAAVNGLLSSGPKHGALIKPNTPRGERNVFAKLTADKVIAIRTQYTGAKGEMKRLGVEFGVHRSLIGLIVHRKIWTHI